MKQNDHSLDCDVVIVNYNAGHSLLDCVCSAYQAGAKRVIVVDNASHDNSLALLAAPTTPLTTVIKNQDNLGFAKACNIGATASHAAFILFLNPDCILAKDALMTMLKVLDAHDQVGMVGGLLVNPDGSEQPGGRRDFPTVKKAFTRAFGLSFLARFFPRLFSDFLLHTQPIPTHPVPVEAISGACMLVKRTAMEAVGHWDEGYFLHCEDLDWCMRFWQNNWQVWFVPDAVITHSAGVCSKTRPWFVQWHKHRGMLRFYRKFFYHQYPGLLWVLVYAGVWLRFAAVMSYHSIRRILPIGLSQ